ncbi:MAG: hypothetical protein KIT60_07030 [Burkholderiaceae bacterium]|nr:hypothetical protein [Burkholderiaceae bacterium]
MPLTALPPGFKLGVLEPRDAIAAFQRRALLEPSFRWQDVFQEEHARAFAVAGVMRLDVLQLFQQQLQVALAEGQRFEQFAKEMMPRLVGAGFWGDVKVTDPESGDTRLARFDRRRLGLIFDVNLRQSQAAGRWAGIERAKARFPFIMYRTMRDERVRASHRPWDGVVLPVDHEWWHTHYPPNGWRCRCTAFGIDERGIDRMRAKGLPVKTVAPETRWITYVNPRTGQIAPVPHGIDPGFAYNPGQQRDAAFFDAMLDKAARSSPLAGASVVAQATADHQAMVAQATGRFGDWATRVIAAGQARGEMQYVGAIAPAAVRAMALREVEPASAAIAVRDQDLLHTLRSSKIAGGRAVDLATLMRLPELLVRASALLLEKGAKPPALVYVIDLGGTDGKAAKLVVLLDYQAARRVAGKKMALPLNLARTISLVDRTALTDAARYELIWGRL